ncbi:alpha/beta fold hydrolase [Alphaproteobacteria bacterium]|jgi:pimeloyl-ACP methyl ester carboxylesterase|nr:alpha/beta fold hydrolase [Alphaproteobacteria bacterium]
MTNNTTFLLVHGSWHGAWCWKPVQESLAGLGFSSLAIDLPGHGLNASLPASFLQRPLDPAVFASEASPLAEFGIEVYSEAVLQGAKKARAVGANKVIVVGHSMGGVPLTFAAAQHPELFDGLVYLAALAPTPLKPAGAYLELEDQHNNSKLRSVIMADPAQIGALRIDPRSTDANYLSAYKEAMSADTAENQDGAIMHLLTPDAPVSIYGDVADFEPGFGSLNRHYILCTEDQTVMPSTSRAIVDDMNSAWPDHPTKLLELKASHSALLSQPDKLAEGLVSIAST